MGEQVIFDSTLIRTVQPRSCDQCFVHRSKCSRHAPCQACVARQRTCTYKRQPQYRRQNTSITTRRPRPVDSCSTSTSIETSNIISLVEENFYDGDADSSPEIIENGNFASAQITDESFNNLLTFFNGHSEYNSSEWMQLNSPTVTTMIQDNFGQFSNVPSFLNHGLQEPVRSIFRPDCVQDPQCSTAPNLHLALSAQPENLIGMINLFLDQLHPSMPFFKPSYLVDNIHSKRYLYDQPFNALLHAISALAAFQMVQKGPELFRSSGHANNSDFLLAEAVRLHSHTDFGESPVLENVLTSVFLFGCQFCKGNHHAARLRLREAITLAETLGLDDPQTYGKISSDEKDRRLRTYLCLTVIHRVYAIQRDSPVNDYLLTSRRLHTVRSMFKHINTSSDQPDVRVITGLGYMVDLIDFVDSAFVRCWRNHCWSDSNPTHISSNTVSTLLQRYTTPIVMRDSPNDAQRADVLITRHWICHILWEISSRHGFLHEENSVTQMRPDYALQIARDSIKTCESLSMNSLECHGVGLVEKLYDIVTSAIKATQPPKIMQEDLCYNVVRNQNTSASSESSPPGRSDNSWDDDIAMETTNSCLAGFTNRFLVIFASFQGGKHPYLKPYMRMLCELDPE